MRIWDIEPNKLCRQHLLGEHRELHALWTVITKNKKGYAKHPETIRWIGKLKALYTRHEQLVIEMKNRKYNHHTPLALSEAKGSAIQNSFVNTYDEQIQILKNKKCLCKVYGI